MNITSENGSDYSTTKRLGCRGRSHSSMKPKSKTFGNFYPKLPHQSTLKRTQGSKILVLESQISAAVPLQQRNQSGGGFLKHLRPLCGGGGGRNQERVEELRVEEFLLLDGFGWTAAFAASGLVLVGRAESRALGCLAVRGCGWGGLVFFWKNQCRIV